MYPRHNSRKIRFILLTVSGLFLALGVKMVLAQTEILERTPSANPASARIVNPTYDTVRVDGTIDAQGGIYSTAGTNVRIVDDLQIAGGNGTIGVLDVRGTLAHKTPGQTLVIDDAVTVQNGLEVIGTVNGNKGTRTFRFSGGSTVNGSGTTETAATASCFAGETPVSCQGYVTASSGDSYVFFSFISGTQCTVKARGVSTTSTYSVRAQTVCAQ